VIGKIYVAESTENNLESHKAGLVSAETNNAIAARNSEINDSVNNENPLAKHYLAGQTGR
jgi:hypothetical protein